MRELRGVANGSPFGGGDECYEYKLNILRPHPQLREEGGRYINIIIVIIVKECLASLLQAWALAIYS
jgi:hypothetical protein